MIRTAFLLWAALASQSPDSAARAALTRAIFTTRDSVRAVRRSAAAFRRDLGAASPDLVVARSQAVRSACAGAIPPATALDSLLSAQPRERGTPVATRARVERRLGDLRATLARCEKEFDPGYWYTRSDSLRAWGPYRLQQIENVLRAYEYEIQTYVAAIGLRYSS